MTQALDNISGLGLGTWLFGGKGWQAKPTQAEISRWVSMAVDGGISVIDTAPIYGQGRAESLLAEPLRSIRDKIILVTKCSLVWDDRGHIKKDNSPKIILSDIRASLKRLATDAVDVLLVHWPDGMTPTEDICAGLNEAIKRGYCRYVGLSNWDVNQIPEFKKHSPITVLQDPCNLAQPHSAHTQEMVRTYGLWTMGYSPLAQGLLTGKYTDPPHLPKNDFRNYNPLFFEPQFSKVKSLIAALQEKSSIARNSLTDFALRYVQTCCNIAVIGIRNEKQLKEVITVHQKKLDAHTMKTIEDIYQRVMTH